jgi:hypothetical protein
MDAHRCNTSGNEGLFDDINQVMLHNEITLNLEDIFFFFGSNLEDLNGINDGSNQLPPSLSATSLKGKKWKAPMDDFKRNIYQKKKDVFKRV